MSKSDDLMKQLTDLINKSDSSGGPECSMPIADRMEMLTEYSKNPTSYPVGTFVVRNKFGQQRYKFPKDDDVAIILDTFPPTCKDDADRFANGVIAIVAKNQKGEHAVTPFSVDLRCYKPTKKM